MYNNIGKKIKTLAKVIFTIELIGSIIAAILLFAESANHSGDEELIIGLIVLIGGPLLAWIGGFFMYGFGELVDSAMSINRKLGGEQNSAGQQSNAEQAKDLHDKGLITDEEYSSIINMR